MTTTPTNDIARTSGEARCVAVSTPRHSASRRLAECAICDSMPIALPHRGIS
jgi:hypothetical protein